MKKAKYLSGSGHLVILSIICVILVSAGLFMAYQKSIDSKKTEDNKVIQQDDKKDEAVDTDTINNSAEEIAQDSAFLTDSKFIELSNTYKATGAGKFINDFYVEYMKTIPINDQAQTNAFVEKNSTDRFIGIYREFTNQERVFSDRIICAQNSFDENDIKYANPKTEGYVESYDIYLPFSTVHKINVQVTNNSGSYKIVDIICPNN